MRIPRRMSVAATMILSAAATSATAVVPDVALYGPTAYLSFADSPFSGLSFAYFHLDDFESGTRSPGYTSTTGGVVLAPGTSTDSVDVDIDGINGSGNAGRSWFSNGTTGVFTFEFDEGSLGRLPTHVGIVWTDVGTVQPDPEFPENPVTNGFARVSFVAYGAGGSFIDAIQTPDALGDGSVNGTTAEDRFFGIASASGISRIEIYSLYSQDWEVDHLQYGALNPVPEPAQWLLMALGAGLVGMRQRRTGRRRSIATTD